MRVAVKLYATLADFLPAGTKANRVEVDVTAEATLASVLAPFNLPPRLTHLVLLNGVFIAPADRPTTLLKEGDTVAVWPPIAGG